MHVGLCLLLCRLVVDWIGENGNKQKPKRDETPQTSVQTQGQQQQGATTATGLSRQGGRARGAEALKVGGELVPGHGANCPDEHPTLGCKAL